MRDLRRRDFTVNTLCMNERGEILDVLNIKEDFENDTVHEEDLNQNVGNSINIIDNISNSVNIIVSSLQNFVDYVNELNNTDKNVYDELKKMVKMPDESSIQEMIKLKEDINSAKDILQNENFVKNLK